MFEYSLSHSLVSGRVKAFDTDAAAYISAVQATGVSMTGAQRNAINTFVVAEKAASRWTSIKRFYLPVWGAASANAICMKSLTTGTFGGTVTHGSGFIQGNGSTGYFQSDTNPATQGLTTATGMVFVLLYTAPTGGTVQAAAGAISGGFTRRNLLLSNNTSFQSAINSNATICSYSVAQASHVGIWVGSRVSTTDNTLYQRTTSGFNNRATNATTATVDAATTKMIVMARAEDSDTTRAQFCNASIGAAGFGLGLSTADTTAFTSNLKTLWETVTGLTLP